MRRKAAVHLSFESALRPAKIVEASNKVKWVFHTDAQPGVMKVCQNPPSLIGDPALAVST